MQLDTVGNQTAVTILDENCNYSPDSTRDVGTELQDSDSQKVFLKIYC